MPIPNTAFKIAAVQAAHPMIQVAEDPACRFMEERIPTPLEPRKKRKRQRDKPPKK
ncbi:MAG: hypothetical protein KKH04_18570 [Proteobacteria bacterium]|nr:hypothetical protein [Pseudomonadota bacterium]